MPILNGKYVPEDAIAQTYKQADNLSNQRWAPNIYGNIAAGIGAVGGNLIRGSAQNALTGNQEMRTGVLRDAAAAPDNASMSKILLGSEVPGLGEQGFKMLADSREKAQDRTFSREDKVADRAAALENQKQLYGFQRRLQQDLKDDENARQMELIKSIREGQGSGETEGAPMATMPDGSAAPVSFADELLGGMHKGPTTEQKAATAIALGAKDKAVDILTEKGKLTEGQTKDAQWAERMIRAEADINAVAPTDGSGKFLKYDPAAASNVAWPNEGILGQMGNSDEWKRYHRAGREALAVILRKDSGGAITPEEWSGYAPIYLPQPNDPPAVILEKRRARVAIARGLRSGSGEAFDKMFPKFNDMMRRRLTSMGADVSPQAPQASAATKQATQFNTSDEIPEGAKVKDDQGNMFIKKNGQLVPMQKPPSDISGMGNEVMMGQ